jgi:hypothetical protein
MPQNQGLGASATSGIAAGVTVVGIAILAALVWFIMRKKHKAIHASETAGPTPGEPDKNEETAAGSDYYATEPTHELLGDDTWAATSDRTSNRVSELDSVRPASELSSVRPASELDSTHTNHKRWSANNAAPMSPTSLPDVQENEAASFRSQRDVSVGTAIKRSGHARYKSA